MSWEEVWWRMALSSSASHCVVDSIYAVAIVNSPPEDNSPAVGDHRGPVEVDSNPGPGPGVAVAAHSNHHHRRTGWEEDHRNAT